MNGLSSALYEKRRDFRNEGCCARDVSDTRKRGRKRGQQPPFASLRSLFLGRKGEWLMFRRPRRRSSGRKRLPSKYWFARPRNARVATRVVSGEAFSSRRFCTGVLGLLRIGFPLRHSASLLGARSRQVFLRTFSFSNLKTDFARKGESRNEASCSF